MKGSFSNIGRAFKRLFQRKGHRQEAPMPPSPHHSEQEVLEGIRNAMERRGKQMARRRYRLKARPEHRRRVMRFNGEKHYYLQRL